LGERLQTSKIQIEPKVVRVDSPLLRQVFPTNDFYAVYMPRWPRAVTPPEGLSYETIVVLRNGESVQAVRGYEELRLFLANSLTEITSEDRARTVVEASLVLAAYGSPSGPYEMKEPVVSIVRQNNGLFATGQVEVREPGRGEIKITMEFNAVGRTNSAGIVIGNSIRPGPPPR
jgi:hypothetical protein